MNKSTGAFLDQYPLSSAGQVNWQLTEGVEPFRTTFIVEKDTALKIINDANNKPQANPYFILSLVPGSSSVTEEAGNTFENLVFISYEPHSDPRFYRLNFADNRVFWSRSYFRGDFNIRTTLGNKEVLRYLTGGTAVLQEFGGSIPLSAADRVEYRTYSLYPPLIDRDAKTTARPWKASEMIAKILSKISQDIPWAIENSKLANDFKQIEFLDEVLKEDIELDGQSHSALNQILELVPNVGIYVDQKGSTRLYNKHTGKERILLNKFDYAFPGSEIPLFVDNKWFIPEYVDVQFESEIEMRFDYTERDDIQTTIENAGAPPFTGDPVAALSERRALENVIQIPDPSFFIISTLIPRSYIAYAGQFVSIDDYIASIPFNVGALFTATGVTITKPFLREYLLNGLYDLFALTSEALEKADARVAWQRRLEALKQNYRRTFRINKFWRNRMTNLQANRVAFLSPTEPLRPPSPVYMDYSKRVTYKGARALQTGDLIGNVFNYDPDISKATPCPWAYISFLGSNENSIFSLNLNQDPYGHNEIVYPYRMANVPCYNYGRLLRASCFDDYAITGAVGMGPLVGSVPPVTTSGLTGPTSLGGPGAPASSTASGKPPPGSASPDMDMFTIFTATPVASPGVKLYTKRVFPKDLDQPFRSKFTGAVGAPLKIKVPASVQTARFVWGDDLALEFEEAFGVFRNNDGTTTDANPDYAKMESNLLNPEAIEAIAKQFAIQALAPYTPRFRGSLTSQYKNVTPDGTISRIIHNVTTPSGALTTSVSIDAEFVPPSWIQLLPRSIRAFVQKFVKQGTP